MKKRSAHLIARQLLFFLPYLPTLRRFSRGKHQISTPRNFNQPFFLRRNFREKGNFPSTFCSGKRRRGVCLNFQVVFKFSVLFCPPVNFTLYSTLPPPLFFYLNFCRGGSTPAREDINRLGKVVPDSLKWILDTTGLFPEGGAMKNGKTKSPFDPDGTWILCSSKNKFCMSEQTYSVQTGYSFFRDSVCK